MVWQNIFFGEEQSGETKQAKKKKKAVQLYGKGLATFPIK